MARLVPLWQSSSRTLACSRLPRVALSCPLALPSPREPALQRRQLHSTHPLAATAVPAEQHEQILRIAQARIQERTQLLAETADGERSSQGIKKLRRIKQLDPLHEAYSSFLDLRATLASSLPLLQDPDPTLRELAAEEISELQSSLVSLLSDTLPALLLPPSRSAALSCILELKAGAGGDEAALFCGEIAEMYIKYAAGRGWKVKVLDETKGTEGGLDGLKDCQIEIKGEGAYGMLRWENGVHRVQRVPATETKGRTHTSTIAVVVLPIDENPTVEDLGYVAESDVKTETMRASGAGGQHVNKTESAIRLTHIPTGIQVHMRDSRSQHQNRAQAWIVLRAKMHAHRKAIQDEENRAKRKTQLPGMDRADKIRTWNFPQDRVTDHRVPLHISNIPELMAGEIQELLDAVGDYQRAQRMEGLLGGDEDDDDG